MSAMMADSHESHDRDFKLNDNTKANRSQEAKKGLNLLI